MRITKINGKYYDLTNFNHPGGETAIWHSFGRDSTILFESHHPFVSKEKLEIILKKYEILELPKGINLLVGEENVPKFNFNTEFSTELKLGVKKYFLQQSKIYNINLLKATKATYWKWFQIIIFTILRLIAYLFWINGYYISILLFPLFSWFANVNSFHDASHFALSTNQIINNILSYSAPEFTSPLTWKYQHNIGHHSYTNIPKKDPDLYHGSYLCRKTKDTQHNFFHNYQNILVTLEWLFTFIGITILASLRMFFSDFSFKIIPKLHSRKDTIIDLLDRFIFINLFLIYPFITFDFKKAIIFSLIPRIIYSLFFMLNSQITHLHTPCLIHDNDWYAHQVRTSTNHSMDNWFNFVFSGGLNYQIEHHLFPNINHCHHPYIQPIVKRICKKHKIEYKEFNGYYDAFISYCKHISLMSLKNI